MPQSLWPTLDTAAMSPAAHSSQESSTCHHKHIIRDGLFLWNIIQPSVHQIAL